MIIIDCIILKLIYIFNKGISNKVKPNLISYFRKILDFLILINSNYFLILYILIMVFFLVNKINCFVKMVFNFKKILDSGIKKFTIIIK